MAKKAKKVISMLLINVLLLAGCGMTEENAQISITPIEEVQDNITTEDIIEITEKMYVTWINEIYTNYEDYLGKTIKLQGVSNAYYDEATKQTYYSVYRTGPGCCSTDGIMCGFEYSYDGKMPETDEWIEVIGVLDSYMEDDNLYITLRADSVEILDTRGAEVVTQ